MATYLVGHIRIKDAILWQQYVDGVRESLRAFAAEVVFRGAKTAVLAGEHPYEQVVLIHFADQAMLQQWFSSQEYQSLIPLRDRAAEVMIASYEG
ncbi:Uncharacterized conserved protein, DUF1330 family [Geoalkalibacter ferrihydriticus]|uniref:DUF1330 domain-containing protein n=2 Tax=Geoalkalibacter ferrihydriticus TaxID=392333 RepID=A0A0C2HJP8_9BACT|nr:DUF1330 domain-containing protein [Geoalkalibacter ferrihydriticus]KIH77291.1 hypothetical protein GFER_00565 [Geoalkalibacter ferrihydriticus DSM 17813]SDM21436.1 Uncharacterized conserved protein, DUF1330 family [Geoalkalibacter ferrihydriticus]